MIAVHGVDAQEGRVGLWMDLVRGATLEQQLAAHGSFSAGEAAAIGIDLCRALAAIHGAGLIHRDVKAQNVMREDGGRIVLMDLGTGREAERTLAAGVPEMAGTPLYLAPEIFAGSPASPRTDLYSLGVLLYHLVTGSFPVKAATIDRLQAAHASGAGVRLRDARADLPTAFVRVIDRAIAAEPSKRYQSAGELEADLADAIGRAAKPEEEHGGAGRFRRLTRWGGMLAATAAVAVVALLVGRPLWRHPAAPAFVPGSVKSIAVLPLVNLSGDPNQEYFADGMTDELIGTLGRLSNIAVISRTSTMQFKGSKKSAPDIAKALNVDAVVEGSVTVVGEKGAADAGRRVRVNARLIYGGSDTQLWDRTFEAVASDVLRLQGDVAKAVAEGIQARLTSSAAPQGIDPRAFDAYLRGRYLWNKRTPEDLRSALAEFKKAVDFDPASSIAWTGLADAYLSAGEPKRDAAKRGDAEIRSRGEKGHRTESGGRRGPRVPGDGSLVVRLGLSRRRSRIQHGAYAQPELREWPRVARAVSGLQRQDLRGDRGNESGACARSAVARDAGEPRALLLFRAPIRSGNRGAARRGTPGSRIVDGPRRAGPGLCGDGRLQSGDCRADCRPQSVPIVFTQPRGAG